MQERGLCSTLDGSCHPAGHNTSHGKEFVTLETVSLASHMCNGNFGEVWPVEVGLWFSGKWLTSMAGQRLSLLVSDSLSALRQQWRKTIERAIRPTCDCPLKNDRFLRQRPALTTQHVRTACGVWVIDCAPRQAYNVRNLSMRDVIKQMPRCSQFAIPSLDCSVDRFYHPGMACSQADTPQRGLLIWLYQILNPPLPLENRFRRLKTAVL
jgi:hypothetical protein